MEYLVAKIRDKIRNSDKTGKVVSTYFLTPAEIQEVSFLLRGRAHVIDGGYEEAERRIIVMGTEEIEASSDFLSVIRVTSFQELSHRSVLGSILGLGIKREMIGDIIVKENNCDIIIIREMQEYILNNLQKIGREKVKVHVVRLEELLPVDSSKEQKIISVASLRIDGLVSSAFGLSREKSTGLVEQEKVLLNFLPCTNQAKAVKAGDLISVRGYGRVRLIEIVGETRKGRVRVKIEQY